MWYALREAILPIGLLILTLIFAWFLNTDRREDPKFTLLLSLLFDAPGRRADHPHRHAA